MKAMNGSGENWHLSDRPENDTPAQQLQRIVTASAIANAGLQGVNPVLNAYLSACVNVVAYFDLDPAELQRMLRALADQTPEMIAAHKLSVAPSANSENKPS